MSFISRYPYQQNSKEIFLEAGKKILFGRYFLAGNGGDHIDIDVYLPVGSNLLPITAHCLSADHFNLRNLLITFLFFVITIVNITYSDTVNPAKTKFTA